MTWGRNPRDAHILAGVQQQIYSTHEVFDSSGSISAGSQQIYSTGVQQTTSTGAASDSDFDVKDGSVVTWGVNDRDAHFLAGVQQQIYSTHEVFDSSGSISAGSQQIYSTGVQQTTSTGAASDSDFDVKDGSVVTWGVNDRDAHFLAGVQQQIYSTHEVSGSSGSFSAGIQQTDVKLEGAQQIYSTRKHGMMQDGSAVTWGVNERGDVCLSNVCSQIFEAPCQHAKTFLTREKKITCRHFYDVRTPDARFGEIGSESQFSTTSSLGVRHDVGDVTCVSASAGVQQSANAHLLSSVLAGVKQIYPTRGDSDTGKDAEKKITCTIFSDVQAQDASCERIGSESQVFTISCEVLASVIRKLKKGKGSPDGITAEMFEALPEPALEKLTSFFNKALLGLIFRRVGQRRKPYSSLR